MVAPASAKLTPAFAAVTVLPAPHVVGPRATAVFTRFAGYVSVNAAPVIGVTFGFVSVIVRTDASLVPIDDGENALATVRVSRTVSVADAAAVLPALAVVM